MSLETFLAVWGRLTPGVVIVMVLYTGAAALLAALLRWLRPRWTSAAIVAATSLPIPLVFIVLGVWVYFETSADTRPWTDFDKAEGFAAAYWLGLIIAPPALLVGAIGAACGLASFRRLKTNGRTSE